MLCGQALMEFDKLQSQYGGTTNNHLKIIQEGLLEYFFLINALTVNLEAFPLSVLRQG